MTGHVNLKTTDVPIIAGLVRIFGLRHGLFLKKPGRSGIYCPHCREPSVRAKRRGGKDACARLLGLYPWRCPDCRYRFYRLRR